MLAQMLLIRAYTGANAGANAIIIRAYSGANAINTSICTDPYAMQ